LLFDEHDKPVALFGAFDVSRNKVRVNAYNVRVPLRRS
jgi:hypothetical protein